jgi:hypothetical protein
MEGSSSGAPEQEDEMRDIKIDDDGTRRIVGEPGNAIPLDDDYGRLPLDPPSPPSLRVVDSGHWAFLYRGEERLLAVSLDGDSIEGKRSPEAEKRIECLRQLAAARKARPPAYHQVQLVPVTRTYRKAPADLSATDLGRRVSTLGGSTWFCCAPDCPGLPYKASEQRHPCGAGGSDAQ